MTLRQKILLIIGATLLALLVGLYIISSTVFLKGFARLESQELQWTVQRAMNGFRDELTSLKSKATDWAVWNETYASPQKPTDGIARATRASSLADLRVNLIVLLNQSGRVVLSKAYDLSLEKEVPVPASFLKSLTPSSPLLHHADISSVQSGVVVLPDSPMLIVACPILSSQRKEPMHGTLILGRWLDSKLVRRVAQESQLTVTVQRFDQPELPPDFAEARRTLAEKSRVWIRTLEDNKVAGYTLWRDIYNQPALLVRVSVPRTIYAKGQETIRYIVGALFVAGLVFGAVMVMLLEILVVSRLSRVINDVRRIEADSDFEGQILVSGRDELARLAEAINRMLGALSDHQLRASANAARMTQLHECLLSFGTEPLENIDRLTTLGGQLLGAHCALYSRLDGGLLVAVSQWNAPPDFAATDKANGRVCFDVIREGRDEVQVIRRLPSTGYAVTDPRVRAGQWQTYVGKSVKFGETAFGTVAVVYQSDVDPSEDDRRLIGIIASAITVEEKRQLSQDALTESEELFRSLSGSSPLGIFMTDPEGQCTYANQRCCTILGRSLPDMLGHGWTEALALAERALVMTEMCACQEEGRLYSREVPVARRDGPGCWINLRSSVIIAETGGVLGHVATIEDITARKRVEAEHARLIQAVEQAAESIVITDTEGNIVYANPAFERVTGYVRREVLGQRPGILKSGKHDQAFYEDLWATLRAGKVWTGHFTNRRKNGSLYEEEAVISPVRNSTGQIVNYVAVKRDVTYERQVEEQLLQAQKMEAVGRLAGGVAHDFNNILTAITGYSELLKRQLPPAEPTHIYAQEIEKAGHRAASLTRQLLAFSRKQLLQPKVLDLNAVMADMEKMLRRVIGEDIEFRTRPGRQLGRIKADPGQVEQVIMNLAVNARDAMPRGGKLTIETENVVLDEDYARQHVEVTPGPYVRLAMSDNGTGMSAEVQAHLFEPFFTTKPQGRGTGLGLATCYGIVKQSGGHIAVQSELGKGTVFSIYLPRIEELALEPVGGDDGDTMPHGTETVLLVEDEEAVREIAALVLAELGYQVLVASDGIEALGVARGRNGDGIDLLVTDVVMPQMGGKELAEHLHIARPETKVLFTSGYTEDAIVHEGIIDPGIAFLEKPYTPGTLARKVREVLDAQVGVAV